MLQPGFYTETDAPTADNLWLGAADDVIMRERGVEFVDGTAPGFAAITGAAPDVETAVMIAQQLKEKMLYVFIVGKNQVTGESFAEQLVEGGVELGWNTRLVPFSPYISGHIFSLGFATRAALAFGGVQPSDYRNMLKYNKDRVFAFVMAFAEVSDKKYAAAAGAISFGFPTIADTDIPEILPTGVCTYEHVVSNVPHDEMVARAIEVRGLKVVVTGFRCRSLTARPSRASASARASTGWSWPVPSRPVVSSPRSLMRLKMASHRGRSQDRRPGGRFHRSIRRSR